MGCGAVALREGDDVEARHANRQDVDAKPAGQVVVRNLPGLKNPAQPLLRVLRVPEMGVRARALGRRSNGDGAVAVAGATRERTRTLKRRDCAEVEEKDGVDEAVDNEEGVVARLGRGQQRHLVRRHERREQQRTLNKTAGGVLGRRRARSAMPAMTLSRRRL
eukprot:6199819-Prymnesium_polylepis.2